MDVFVFLLKKMSVSNLLPLRQLLDTKNVILIWQRCKIYGDTFTIGSQQAFGLNTITYSSELKSGWVILPFPIQDSLTTIIRDCNADWYA
jgi:hypothetical protein